MPLVPRPPNRPTRMLTPSDRSPSRRSFIVPRHRSLARRAIVNICGVAVLALAGCDRTAAPDPRAASASAEARIAELIEVLTPLEKTVTSDITDAKFHRGQELLAELSKAGPDVGRAALAELRGREGKSHVVAVESGLLAVAARAATAETVPLLESLVTEYGPTLDVRTEAATLLAEVAPERALAVIAPYVSNARPGKTMPPQEFLVRAWADACKRTKRSPVPELANVATNLFMEAPARVAAVHVLGQYPEDASVLALRTILVESTGDGYLRRMAAQALRNVLPRETACSIFREAGSREADLNMQAFLVDLISKNCE